MTFTLGIIPARGGSKGIPKKNIRMIAGKPLIAWTIEAALNAATLDAVLVSTDDVEIAKVAGTYGLPTERLRPVVLSGDTARTVDVLAYEIEEFEKSRQVQVSDIVLLQPTAPLRTAADIDASCAIYKRTAARSLISVYDASHVHPSIMYTKQGEALALYEQGKAPVRRQDMAPVFVRNGAIYITDRDLVMNEKLVMTETPAFYEMPRERSVNVDEIYDLALAEWALTRGTP
jgi:CMP-N-acetylneuraminic acid synthetase